jgi:hypothetical protein
MGKPVRDLMVPFSSEIASLFETQSSVGNLMIYGRPLDDFQSSCLLFQAARHNAMTAEVIDNLRASGMSVCYAYDMQDLENREFTIWGYQQIRKDIDWAISAGFSHIMLSNAYLIELVCNEYHGRINVIVSPLLECNSARASVFFEVLNDTSAITHIVATQNRMDDAGWESLKAAFPNQTLVIEADRWTSDLQMVHEHYYNVAYGYWSPEAQAELKRFVRDDRFRSQIKQPSELLRRDESDVTWKVGEMNAPPDLVRRNLEAIWSGRLANVDLVDPYLW